MSEQEGESTPPVAADDFPEFAEPPRHRPAPEPDDEAKDETSGEQAAADAVLERLRRERAEGGR